MQITFTPMRHDTALTLLRQGDMLVLNGTALDLSGIPEGATLPRAAAGCDWLASDIERSGGRLRLTLILPHGPEAPPETLFPAPLTLEGDGPVALPPFALPPLTETPDEA